MYRCRLMAKSSGSVLGLPTECKPRRSLMYVTWSVVYRVLRMTGNFLVDEALGHVAEHLCSVLPFKAAPSAESRSNNERLVLA